jgi:hypothetical protein
LIFERSILFFRRNHNRNIDPGDSREANGTHPRNWSPCSAIKKEEDMLKEGSKAPAFCLPAAEKDNVCLKDFAGKWVVLYFYPKDSTSG